MILIDFDGVIADLHTEWLKRFNGATGSSLTRDDITSWDPEPYIPDPWHREVYFSLLKDHDLYDCVQPMDGAVKGLRELDLAGIEWSIATSCGSMAMVYGKVRWLKRYGLAVYGEGRSFPDNLTVCHQKAALGGSLLVDDGLHNVDAWRATNAPNKPIIFDQPWNRDSLSQRVHNWPELVARLKARTF